MRIPFLSDGPVAAAQKVVDQLEDRLQNLATRQAELSGACSTLETKLTLAMEAGKSGDTEAMDAAKVKIQIEALVRTRASVEAELEEAKRQFKLAPAVEMRQQAAAKRAELEALRRKEAPLLEKLSALEGVQFDHCILQAQRTRGGSWQHPYDHTLETELFAPTEVASDHGQYALTLSRKLYDEARWLENQAGIIEGTAMESVATLRYIPER